MKKFICYLVGGAVRDEIMGLEPKDYDYVIVGSTPEELISLGYKQVGADFPVFLKDGNEYALARTERKNGKGYLGFNCDFNPNITLKEDQNRRDFSINSIAKDLDSGEYIDYYGGIDDIKNKVLRHVSEAFSEDPLRILRGCRFLARYENFIIHDDTIQLMKSIKHELNDISKDRIWLEIEKILSEEYSYKAFDMFEQLGLFELECLKIYSDWDRYSLKQLSKYRDFEIHFDRKYYAFCCISKNIKSKKEFNDNRIPKEFGFSLKINTYYDKIEKYFSLSPEEKYELFNNLGVFQQTTNDEFIIFFNEMSNILWYFNRSINDKILYDFRNICKINIESLIKDVDKKDILDLIKQTRLKIFEE